MKKSIFLIIAFGVIITGVILIAQLRTTPQDSGKIKVTTTLYPFYDFTRSIAGEKADISLLLPPGVESHSFEPTPSDIIKINESELLIYTSEVMEPWLSDIISGISNKDLKVVELGSGMVSSENDPHVWLDFAKDEIIVQVIADNLSAIDPNSREYFQERASLLKQQLRLLDEKYKNTLSTCSNNKIIYAGHYAFKYLADRYNLKYSAAQGISPDSEPSAQDLASLVNQINSENISYIFYEELTSPKIAETLKRETNVEILLLNAAHNISRDEFIANISFLDIMEGNLNSLKLGLGCTN